MRGTDKQIAYAEQIQTDLLTALDEYATIAPGDPMPADDPNVALGRDARSAVRYNSIRALRLTRPELPTFRAFLAEVDDAAWIINHLAPTQVARQARIVRREYQAHLASQAV